MDQATYGLAERGCGPERGNEPERSRLLDRCRAGLRPARPPEGVCPWPWAKERAAPSAESSRCDAPAERPRPCLCSTRSRPRARRSGPFFLPRSWRVKWIPPVARSPAGSGRSNSAARGDPPRHVTEEALYPEAGPLGEVAQRLALPVENLSGVAVEVTRAPRAVECMPTPPRRITT